MYKLATVEGDGRVELSSHHGTSWLRPEESACVVEVHVGHLYVSSLDAWARDRNLSKQEAQRLISAPEKLGLEGPEIPKFCLAEASRKRRRGWQTLTIQLPDLALWHLFREGEGPLAPKRESRSVRVLVRCDEDGVDVWSQRFGVFGGTAR